LWEKKAQGRKEKIICRSRADAGVNREERDALVMGGGGGGQDVNHEKIQNK